MTTIKAKRQNADQRTLLKKVMRELDKQMCHVLDKGNYRAVEAFAVSYNLAEDHLNAILKEDQR